MENENDMIEQSEDEEEIEQSEGEEEDVIEDFNFEEEEFSTFEKIATVFPTMNQDEVEILSEYVERVDISLLYDVVGMVKNKGINATMEFLISVKNKEDFYAQNPINNDVRKRSEVEKDLLRNRPMMSEIGLARCPKCGDEHTSYVQKQLKRSDEPMTNLYTCLNPICGKRW